MADAMRGRTGADATIWNSAKTADTILGSCKMRNTGIIGRGHEPSQHHRLLAEQGQ